MNYKRIKECYFKIQPGVFLVILILIFSNVGIQAQEKKEKKKKKKVDHWEVKFGLTTFYDNNILKYSDKYLERFMNSEDPGRFSIDTYDDVVINPSIEVVYTARIFKKYKTRINSSFSPRIYVVNSIKDWYNVYIGVQQYLPWRTRIKFLYSYIPDFYVRNFRDDNWIFVYGYTPEAFQPYAFAKDNFGSYIHKTFFKNTGVRLSLYYARYFHNEHYTEYDSKDFLYGIKLYQPVFKNLRLEASYVYVTSDAKGYDASYQTPETTNGPDATYVEDRFTFGFRWKLPKLAKRKNDFDVQFAYLVRYYSSPYSPLVDPLHAGRVDNNYRLFFVYNIDLLKDLDLSLYYHWYMRDSDTESPVNSIYVSNEKDYNQSRIGLSLLYKLKF